MSWAILEQLERFGPDRCEKLSPAQAQEYTRQLARSHYENFTVVSWFLPKPLRQDFQHVYAFCRWADDLGDEVGDPEKSLRLLDWWRQEVDACYAGRPRHPVFVALAPTIQKYDIPRQPFDDLIDAFVQDQTVHRYDTWERVLDYCRRSANPVGRLVLYLCGHRDPQRQQLADATCTALQLTNFWQDVRRDILERNRVYIPEEIARKHQLDIELMVRIVQLDQAQGSGGGCNPSAGACTCAGLPGVGMTAILPAYRATLRELVDRTWPLFAQGRQLWPLLEPQIRLDVQLFTLGGESILHRIQQQQYNTLTHRPILSSRAKLSLMFKALAWKLLTLGGLRR